MTPNTLIRALAAVGLLFLATASAAPALATTSYGSNVFTISGPVPANDAPSSEIDALVLDWYNTGASSILQASIVESVKKLFEIYATETPTSGTVQANIAQRWNPFEYHQKSVVEVSDYVKTAVTSWDIVKADLSWTAADIEIDIGHGVSGFGGGSATAVAQVSLVSEITFTFNVAISEVTVKFIPIMEYYVSDYVARDGSYARSHNTIALSEQSLMVSLNAQPVPSPIAGAGLPMLLAGGALWMRRRSRAT